MKNIALAVALMIAGCQPSFAMSVEACKLYTAITAAAFEARNEGAPLRESLKKTGSMEDETMKTVAEMAIHKAYREDIMTEREDLIVKTFKQCRAGEL